MDESREHMEEIAEECSMQPEPTKKRTRESLNREFGVYVALTKALSRNKVTQPGTHATLLLELFLKKDGKLFARDVFEKGLCLEGKFKVWRDGLVKKGWLDYDLQDAERQKTWQYYRPGEKLVAYINKEKLRAQEIATKAELQNLRVDFNTQLVAKADKEEVDQLRSEVGEIREAMQEIYSAFKLGEIDPPGYRKFRRLADGKRVERVRAQLKAH
jgi:hypothetical protein